MLPVVNVILYQLLAPRRSYNRSVTGANRIVGKARQGAERFHIRGEVAHRGRRCPQDTIAGEKRLLLFQVKRHVIDLMSGGEQGAEIDVLTDLDDLTGFQGLHHIRADNCL